MSKTTPPLTNTWEEKLKRRANQFFSTLFKGIAATLPAAFLYFLGYIYQAQFWKPFELDTSIIKLETVEYIESGTYVAFSLIAYASQFLTEHWKSITVLAACVLAAAAFLTVIIYLVATTLSKCASKLKNYLDQMAPQPSDRKITAALKSICTYTWNWAKAFVAWIWEKASKKPVKELLEAVAALSQVGFKVLFALLTAYVLIAGTFLAAYLASAYTANQDRQNWMCHADPGSCEGRAAEITRGPRVRPIHLLFKNEAKAKNPQLEDLEKQSCEEKLFPLKQSDALIVVASVRENEVKSFVLVRNDVAATYTDDMYSESCETEVTGPAETPSSQGTEPHNNKQKTPTK